jgi:hypothetical protein
MEKDSGLLKTVDDIFDGVTVEESSLPDTVEAFSSMLDSKDAAAEQPKPGLFFIWDHLRK